MAPDLLRDSIEDSGSSDMSSTSNQVQGELMV